MKLSYKNIGIYVGLIAFGFVLAKFTMTSSTNNVVEEHMHNHESDGQIYTCSMHPQIRQNESGSCPICAMDLIPVHVEDGADENSAEIVMSDAAMKLADIQTAVIRKEKPVKEVRLNGKVQADERYMFSQTSHIGGRVERLLISYTGEYVKKGQIIAYIYSPELVTAQEELFEAYKVRGRQQNLYEATRAKLKNWKLTDKQIDGIIESGHVTEDFPIHSDISGVVVAKRVNLGDHIKQGYSLYEVADLSHVWVMLDVYENDMSWVQKGDEVSFTIQSIPGENFTGKISFIDPVINPQTRVARARIEMKNPKQRLKPEMFASGIIKSSLSNREDAFVVPKTAVMWTGTRSVVYVKTKEAKGVHFILRQIELGPELGNGYVVLNGLKSGEEIAVYGTFSIDAAAQLEGKPSMMNTSAKGKKPKMRHEGMEM